MTVEAAIASRQEEEVEEKTKKEKKAKKKNNEIKQLPSGNIDDGENQILFDRVEKMKSMSHQTDDDFDDDMILSSEFMTRKD